ncbi:MAG: glutathione S-transferase N-terminal domain-containing protein [Pseudomonadota bacterium]
MIDFYYWPTPNGWKVAMLLEELGIDYRMIPVNIGKGDQFSPEFLAISPNNRMPAIVDHDVESDPISVFESGAIMWYLADKYGKFLSTDPLERKETMEWLFWQVGGQGPMAGQLSHFVNYAPEDERSYGRKRYKGEYERLCAVLDKRLHGREWIVGDAYSIADMICWPWVLVAKPLGVSLDPFPSLTSWRKRVKERPATQRAVDLGKDMRRQAPPTDEERRLLFQQDASSQRS